MNWERDKRQEAREQLITALLEGHCWQEVGEGPDVPLKRAMAYRLLRAVRTKGNVALQDGRHGHPSKLRGEARAFLEARCREAPCTPSATIQATLRERFDLQVMTVFKVALANLGMWVRDRYFPAQYAHAGWQRLQLFFQLPGRIFWGRDRVEVELKRFNDCALNRDLEALCAKVAQEQPHLPDGRRLLFRVQGRGILLLDAREKEVA